MLSICKFFKLLVISIFLVIGLVNAEELATVDLQRSYDKLKLDFDKSIKKVPIFAQDLDVLDKKQKEFSALNIKLEECIAENTEKLSTSKGNLKLLGEKENSEDRDVKDQRADLEKQIQEIDNELKRCNLLKIQLKEISEETTEKRSVVLKQKLLSKEISLFTSVTKGPFSIDALKPTFTRIFQKVIMWEVFLAILAGLLFGWLLKKQNPIEPIDSSHFSSPTLASIFRGIRRTAPVLIPLLFFWALLKIQTSDTSALVEPLGFALILTFVFALARGIIFPQPINTVEKNAPRFKLLLLIYLTIFFSTIAYALNEPALGRFTNSNVLYLIWLTSMVIAALSFICTLYISIKRLFNDKSHSFYLYIPMTVLVCLIITAVLGYRNLSSLLFFGLTLSITTLFLMYLFIKISSEFFDSLDEGKIQWQSKLRKMMSVRSSQAFPGVLWFRILVFFAVLFLGISALLSIWGGPQQPITSLKGVFQNGLNIGSLNFDVFNIIYALLVMIVTLSVLPYIKNKLILGWLKHSNLSSGAKDATQTLIGYVVLAIATLWALFILGMNFQNLAIIAGALSVGIGFGLQNIVNNFVSGLILLFERPIRRGDWIAVGNTEGYVRDISIRSTTIQTFDKADVIVPNSELISNQVTNWMLSSNIGRLKAAVGVAYGSDVNLVMDILKQIANDHPEVISNNDAYATSIFLLNFGDSSLDFELRCFIRNIDSLVRIKSEINLSIDAAFRKHNIEIPYPQRVINNITEKEDNIDTPEKS